MRKSRIWNNYAHIYSSFQDRIRQIDEIASFVQDKIDDGYEPYFLTFMFNQLNGNKQSILAQMHREIERFNKILITRVHQHPNRRSAIDNLPILIGFADLPTIFKTTKKPLVDIVTNDGLHCHAVLLMPKRSRIKGSLIQHIKAHEEIYEGPPWGPLNRIHALEINRTPLRVVRYVFKAFKWGRISWDDGFILFPKSPSEMLGGSKFNPDWASLQNETKKTDQKTRLKKSAQAGKRQDRTKKTRSDNELHSTELSKPKRQSKAELHEVCNAAYAEWRKTHDPEECRV